eukprot:CAMPEP_0197598668 /NCGR_PEP_ID=MMETSP1326-20131121/29822_1 /TAXON_ID=1155430 /ORGANISM="Genus nov. species nov., Strain RCC2288" /LENGTH=44 /DNA_ID= /DNA_START= /DNA_END= /DNA_ORIENTATION=
MASNMRGALRDLYRLAKKIDDVRPHLKALLPLRDSLEDTPLDAR